MPKKLAQARKLATPLPELLTQFIRPRDLIAQADRGFYLVGGAVKSKTFDGVTQTQVVFTITFKPEWEDKTVPPHVHYLGLSDTPVRRAILNDLMSTVNPQGIPAPVGPIGIIGVGPGGVWTFYNWGEDLPEGAITPDKQVAPDVTPVENDAFQRMLDDIPF